ncbi:MAG: ABC transporter ATP-binding protein [Atopobiaceae bacterium]
MTQGRDSQGPAEGWTPVAGQTSAEPQVPALQLDHVRFSYPEGPGAGEDVLRDASLCVPQGAFALLVGGTGSGKTTLLRLCKPELAPAGRLDGRILAFGRPMSQLSPQESASQVGYVFQSPDNQIVCDTVWHEMAFGLENLGVDPAQMRRRVAETSYFFGMGPWFHRPCAELSGGQRQVLALAATLVLHPRLLLLDEPTSMLDPIAEKGFLSLLFRVNRELGCTVVVATHAPAPMVDVATMAFRVSGGQVHQVELEGLRQRPSLLVQKDEPSSDAGPASATQPGAVHVAAAQAAPLASPSVRQASGQSAPCIRMKDCWQRYQPKSDWVLCGCDLEVGTGEVRALVGGNGCGKSTLLGVVAGVRKFQRGRLRNASARRQVMLPQNPKALFSTDEVGKELLEWSRSCGYGSSDAQAMLRRFGMDPDALWLRHPYDLSGGQQQLLALAKLLLAQPQLLLLDEPTKGLDLEARREVARAVRAMRAQGRTVVVATHDLQFAHQVCDSVSLLFDGQVSCTLPSQEFFRTSWVWRDQ